MADFDTCSRLLISSIDPRGRICAKELSGLNSTNTNRTRSYCFHGLLLLVVK